MEGSDSMNIIFGIPCWSPYVTCRLSASSKYMLKKLTSRESRFLHILLLIYYVTRRALTIPLNSLFGTVALGKSLFFKGTIASWFIIGRFAYLHMLSCCYNETVGYPTGISVWHDCHNHYLQHDVWHRRQHVKNVAWTLTRTCAASIPVCPNRLPVRKDRVLCVLLEPSERPMPQGMPSSHRTKLRGSLPPGTVPCIWLVKAGFRGNGSRCPGLIEIGIAISLLAWTSSLCADCLPASDVDKHMDGYVGVHNCRQHLSEGALMLSLGSVCPAVYG